MSSKTSTKRSSSLSSSSTTRKRPMIAAKQRGPGPGRYALPSTFGSGKTDQTKRGVPSFSFGSKIEEKKKLQTPGPSYIDPAMSRYGRSSSKTSRINARPKVLKSFNTPGPGSYGHLPAKSGPSYSLGIRPPELKKSETPSPGSYDIRKTVTSKQKSSLAYSLGGRLKVGGFSDNSIVSPAPGSYSASLCNKKLAPSFSMSGRTYMPDAGTETPGPGQHALQRVDVTKSKAPAFSMGVKHSEYTTALIIDVPEDRELP
eukprot:m.41088 g.41088  ORF g.41088 m.41088 type:complete len:258 (+) comp6978_c0_seq2:87-860(+)